MSGNVSTASVYYARAIDGVPPAAIERTTLRLRRLVARYEIQLIDPVLLSRTRQVQSPTTLVSGDLEQLRRADAMLMDMSIRHRNYIGCCCELVYAFQWRIPTIVFIGKSGYGDRIWLQYHATAVCTTWRDAISTLVNVVDR